MTDDRLALSELAAKSGDSDFLRTIAESVLQLIMEADVDGLIGAGRYERGDGRQTWRNGYRDRSLDTRLGTLNLKIPKMRQGAYFPGFLEPRKMVEKALVAVIQEAWINGVSTRKVDELVQAMGMTGISKSSVSKLCKDIDERVNAFLKRPLSGDWPYLWCQRRSKNRPRGGAKVGHCGAGLRPPGGLKPERGSRAGVAIFREVFSLPFGRGFGRDDSCRRSSRGC